MRFSFRKTKTKSASSDKKEHRTRRAFGSDDDDSDDPYADFDRALREAARADEDPADAERSSRAAFALVPFEGAGVPYGGVGSNAPSDNPRRLMLERAAPLARSERPHSSHASRLRRGREPYPDRPMARGRFLRSGKGGAGMARGRQVAALEARSGGRRAAARLRRSLELCAGPAAAAARRSAPRRPRAWATRERERGGRGRSAGRRTPPPKPREGRWGGRRGQGLERALELRDERARPFARSPLGVRVGVRGPAAPPARGRATLWKTRGAAPRSPRWGRSRTRRRRTRAGEREPPPAALGDASAPASARPSVRARLERRTARTPPRRNRATLGRRTRPSRVCAAAETGGLSPEAGGVRSRGGGTEVRGGERVGARRVRREPPRRRRSPRGRRARAWGRSPSRTGRRARARICTGSRSCACHSPRNWSGRGAPAAGGGDGRRSSRRERRGGDAFFTR